MSVAQLKATRLQLSGKPRFKVCHNEISFSICSTGFPHFLNNYYFSKNLKHKIIMERFTLLKHSQKEIINILELSKTTFTFTQLEETLIRSDFRCIHGLYFNSIKTLKSCVTRKEISENFFIHYHSKVWTHTVIPHRFLHVKIIVK